MLRIGALWIIVSVPLALLIGRLAQLTNPDLATEVEAYLRQRGRSAARRATTVLMVTAGLAIIVAGTSHAAYQLPPVATVTDWAFQAVDRPPTPPSTANPAATSRPRSSTTLPIVPDDRPLPRPEAPTGGSTATSDHGRAATPEIAASYGTSAAPGSSSTSSEDEDPDISSWIGGPSWTTTTTTTTTTQPPPPTTTTTTTQPPPPTTTTTTTQPPPPTTTTTEPPAEEPAPPEGDGGGN